MSPFPIQPPKTSQNELILCLLMMRVVLRSKGISEAEMESTHRLRFPWSVTEYAEGWHVSFEMNHLG